MGKDVMGAVRDDMYGKGIWKGERVRKVRKGSKGGW